MTKKLYFAIIAHDELFFWCCSGHLKPIWDDDPNSPTDGVPVTEVILNEWWATGFMEGEKPKVGVTTESGNYVLQKPSEEYAGLMKDLEDKVILTKLVIEIIEEDPDSDMSYNDFLLKLTNMTAECLPHFTEETLLNDAEFVINQVKNIFPIICRYF